MKRRGGTKRAARRRTVLRVSRVLDNLADVPLSEVMDDAERFICAVCARPVKLCLSDPLWVCSTKWKEGTVLQALRQTARARPVCVSCGRTLTAAVLRRNPLAEVCPSCRRRSSMTPHHLEKEERHGTKARGA